MTDVEAVARGLQWKPWNGGICPVDVDAEVYYLIRVSAAKAMGPIKAGLLRWDHGRTPDSPLRSNDIVCYRLAARHIKAAPDA